MKPSQTSTTARGIAAIRALESERPEGERICFDPFARRFTSRTYYLLSKVFAGYGEHVAPGTQGFIVCRCRYFDDFIFRSLADGVRQLVILGAGLDSRGYREQVAGIGVRVYEVDQPATQARKIRRVRNVFGKLHENVRFVPVDFTRDSLDKLYTEGFDRSEPSVFVWEGVTYYLSAEAVARTLEWIRSGSQSGSKLIFDYVDAEALETTEKRGEVKRMQRYRRLTGEGLQFGIEKGKAESLLKGFGYANVVDIDGSGLEKTYCVGANQGRKVADIYGIVTGEVA